MITQFTNQYTGWIQQTQESTFLYYNHLISTNVKGIKWNAVFSLATILETTQWWAVFMQWSLLFWTNLKLRTWILWYINLQAIQTCISINYEINTLLCILLIVCVVQCLCCAVFVLYSKDQTTISILWVVGKGGHGQTRTQTFTKYTFTCLQQLIFIPSVVLSIWPYASKKDLPQTTEICQAPTTDLYIQ